MNSEGRFKIIFQMLKARNKTLIAIFGLIITACAYILPCSSSGEAPDAQIQLWTRSEVYDAHNYTLYDI